MILRGVDEHGQKGDNELSLLVLQAAINFQTTAPTLSVWYDDSLSDEFLLKAVECVKTGAGFPAWFNLKIYIQHELERSKLPVNVIRKYAAMGGCTEPTLEGMSYGIVQAGFINHMKLLELAMNGGTDPDTGVKFDETMVPTNSTELLDAYKLHLKNAIRNWQRYWNYVMAAHRQTNDLIYSSVLVRDCLERLCRKNNISKIRLLPCHSLGKEKYKELGRSYVPGNDFDVSRSELERFKETIIKRGIDCWIE